MKRIVVRLSGMPFDPTYEIDDDTVAIGDLVRVPGSNSAFIEDGALERSSPWEAPIPAMQACHPSQVTAYQQELPTVFTSLASRLRGAAKLIPGAAMYHWPPTAVWPGPGRCDTSRRAAWRRGLDGWNGWSVIAARASGVLAGPFLAAGACFSNQAEGSGKPRPM
jgi:hypothetical protein